MKTQNEIKRELYKQSVINKRIIRNFVICMLMTLILLSLYNEFTENQIYKGLIILFLITLSPNMAPVNLEKIRQKLKTKLKNSQEEEKFFSIYLEKKGRTTEKEKSRLEYLQKKILTLETKLNLMGSE